MQPLFANRQASIREYAFSEHNWHDYEALGRSVRHGDYLLVRNFRPQKPWQGPADSVRSPTHQSLLSKRRSQKLTAAQEDVFLAPRPEIELYNFRNDPYQLQNLVGQPALVGIQRNMENVIDTWMEQTGDSIPDVISADTFDRETGNALPDSKQQHASALTPGEDRHADQINLPGPR